MVFFLDFIPKRHRSLAFALLKNILDFEKPQKQKNSIEREIIEIIAIAADEYQLKYQLSF